MDSITMDNITILNFVCMILQTIFLALIYVVVAELCKKAEQLWQ